MNIMSTKLFHKHMFVNLQRSYNGCSRVLIRNHVIIQLICNEIGTVKKKITFFHKEKSHILSLLPY